MADPEIPSGVCGVDVCGSGCRARVIDPVPGRRGEAAISAASRSAPEALSCAIYLRALNDLYARHAQVPQLRPFPQLRLE